MRDTVIVFGAGASCEYGLPTGKGLRDLILSSSAADLARIAKAMDPFDSDHPVMRHARQAPITAFLNAFGAATTPSIDTFLRYQPVHRDLGRLAITLCLLDKEATAAATLPFDRGFYPAVADLLLPPNEGIWPSKLELITFNYDRTAELIIATIYGARYGIDHMNAAFRAATEHTRHVYGSFTMPYAVNREQHCFVPRNRWSGATDRIPPQEYIDSSKGIRVIGEDRAAIPTDLRTTLAKGEEVVFLGFGFDEENLSVLGLKEGASSLKAGCKVRASAYGLAKRQRERLTEAFPGIELGGENVGCAKFVGDLGGL